jgi:glycosyltransferase involved in cell wall biosynthesis
MSVLLTIITINKDNAAGLRRTIESVVPLIGPRVSYLVVDGASTDGSQRVARHALDGLAGARVISEADGGIYAAMNKGWRLATGQYVAYVNSGDEVLPHAYAKFLDMAESALEDVTYARTYLATAAGVRCGIHERHPEDLVRDTLPHPATLIKREMLSRVGGFDERFRIVADRDLFIRIHRQGATFKYCPEVVSVFYLGGASAGWRAGLESARVSHVHGYLGGWGWGWRRLWFTVFRLHPSVMDAWLPHDSAVRKALLGLLNWVRRT